jgi:uncharacterized protein YabE (DUF348 family)
LSKPTLPLLRFFFKLIFSLVLVLGGLGIFLAFAYLLGESGRAQVGLFANPVAESTMAKPANAVPVTIVQQNAQYMLYTTADNVAGALRDAGVVLESEDRVEPPLTTPLQSEMQITVFRSVPVTIRVDGQTLQQQINGNTVGEVLAAAGITLTPADYARPDVDTLVQPGMSIEVMRITETFADEDQPLPFETVWEPTDTLELDTEGLLVPGVEGILRRRWRVTYENGIEIDRTLADEWVAQEPVTAVMGYGTNIVIRVLDTDEGPLPYWRKVTMRVTSYTASSAGRPPDHPDYGRTASGYYAQQGIVAVDPRIVPFGSWVYVPNYGISFAGDTGGGVLGRWIDLGYDEESFIPWSGYVDVYYLTPVPRPERITYRLPTELP